MIPNMQSLSHFLTKRLKLHQEFVVFEKVSVADFYFIQEYLTRVAPEDDEKKRELRARVTIERLAYYADRVEAVIGRGDWKQ